MHSLVLSSGVGKGMGAAGMNSWCEGTRYFTHQLLGPHQAGLGLGPGKEGEPPPI